MTTTYQAGAKRFESDLTTGQVLSSLKGLSNPFAQSLVKQANHWSTKQEAWAHWLVLEAATKAQTETPRPAFPAIVDLFATAAGSLKYPPRVTFRVNGYTVRLQRSGDASHYAGQIQVTDGRRYPDNLYYGRIDHEGQFHAGRDCHEDILAALAEINADPAEALGRLGRADGSCCFCGLDLTDEKSTVVGYGPVCAKNWGLPHVLEHFLLVSERFYNTTLREQWEDQITEELQELSGGVLHTHHATGRSYLNATAGLDGCSLEMRADHGSIYLGDHRAHVSADLAVLIARAVGTFRAQALACSLTVGERS